MRIDVPKRRVSYNRTLALSLVLIACVLVTLFFGLVGAAAFADYRYLDCPGAMQCSDAKLVFLLCIPIALAGATGAGISIRALILSAHTKTARSA
jgi:hypothetical protein